MNRIDVYNSDGVAFDVEELRLKELPPIPDWFTEALTEAGGKFGDYPNVRVVSGLDPDVVEYYGERWWKKYAFREHSHTEYFIWHRAGKKDTILSPKEAEVVAKRKEGILTLKVDRQIKEHGIPRYFVELYKPPHAFGTQEIWDTVRYDKDENDKWIDLMGDFPHNGMYETWFCIEEPVFDKDGKMIGTKLKELDETVLEFIKFKIEEIKAKTVAMQHQEIRDEVDKDFTDYIKEGKQNIKDIVAEHADKLIGTPKITVPTKYERD